ncbi:MAG: NAD(P)-dependent oxidoreductase [Acidobacteria bacterium]|nr:NAD(P)-dependent oxidoreductase [Acidobacteriota bacterium]
MPTRVLVTGGCGFLGQHVVPILLDRGYKVSVADNLSSPNSTRNTHAPCEFHLADLSNQTETLAVMRNVDICVAMAANVSGVGYFSAHPGSMLSNNTSILLNTFEAARRQGVSKIVYISSSSVYTRTHQFPLREGHEDRVPHDGYPFSKLLGESFCRSFFAEYGIEFVIVRPFNLYGPGESPVDLPGFNHVIPSLAIKLLRRESPITMLGNGDQRRTFTHVKDCARGIVDAMAHPALTNDSVNLAGTEEISIRQLITLMHRLCGIKEQLLLESAPSASGDIARRPVDVSKARNILGWRAEIPLEIGLAETLSWMEQKLRLP